METNQIIQTLNSLIEEQEEYQRCLEEGIRFDFYYHELSLEEQQNLQEEFPELIPPQDEAPSENESNSIFVVNLISSEIMEDGRFRKLRYYINQKSEMVRVLDSH